MPTAFCLPMVDTVRQDGNHGEVAAGVRVDAEALRRSAYTQGKSARYRGVVSCRHTLPRQMAMDDAGGHRCSRKSRSDGWRAVRCHDNSTGEPTEGIIIVIATRRGEGEIK